MLQTHAIIEYDWCCIKNIINKFVNNYLICNVFKSWENAITTTNFAAQNGYKLS